MLISLTQGTNTLNNQLFYFMRQQFCLTLILLCLSFSVFAETKQNIILRKPPNNNHGEFIAHFYNNLYQLLGYEVEYIEVPSQLELDLVKKGALSGMIARDVSYGELLPELVKIDVPLFSYEVYLVSDRRQCGYCFLSELEQVYSQAGIKIYSDIAELFPSNIERKFYNPSYTSSTDILFNPNTGQFFNSISLPENIKSNPHLIKKVMDIRNDHHFLAPHMGHLKPKIEQVLTEQSSKGYLQALRNKYKLTLDNNYESTLPASINAVIANGDLSVVSSYKAVIENVLKDQLKTNVSETNWTDAIQKFRKGKADIFIGITQDMVKEYPTSTYHIDYQPPVYLMAQSQEILDSFNNRTSTMTICSRESLRFLLSEFDRMHSVHTVDNCLELFEQEKVDIVFDLQKAEEKVNNNKPQMPYINGQPLFVVFQNNAVGRQLKTLFDNNIAQLAETGALKQFYVDPQQYLKANIESPYTKCLFCD